MILDPLGRKRCTTRVAIAIRHAVAATAATLVASCAATPVTKPMVPMLDDTPERPHQVIAPLEARTEVGFPIERAYEELRSQAAALGADAVVRTEVRPLSDLTPAPYTPPERPLIGNPYPGPLYNLEPGAFPPAGSDWHVRGRYYVVEGIAIRYVD